MDPASSKLLLWLLSLTRDRESSSSEHTQKKICVLVSTGNNIERTVFNVFL